MVLITDRYLPDISLLQFLEDISLEELLMIHLLFIFPLHMDLQNHPLILSSILIPIKIMVISISFIILMPKVLLIFKLEKATLLRYIMSTWEDLDT
jgi:hypothetical protein